MHCVEKHFSFPVVLGWFVDYCFHKYILLQNDNLNKMLVGVKQTLMLRCEWSLNFPVTWSRLSKESAGNVASHSHSADTWISWEFLVMSWFGIDLNVWSKKHWKYYKAA